MRIALSALLLLAGALPAPIAAAITTRTILAVPTARSGWFVCDSVDSPWAALVGKVAASGTSDITLVAKHAGTTSTIRYTVGQADPGAGQIYYALSRGGAEVGNLHAVNPGLLDPSLPEPLNFTSVSIGGKQLGCRLIDNIRLMAVTARRGVTVTRDAGQLAYRSYDFAHPGAVVRPDGVQQTNAPSLLITGGVETHGAGGADSFRFVNRGYSYRISLPAGRRAGTLTVMRAGRTLLTERLLGFTLVSG